MPNLLIVGESGMGKTMIIEKFTRDHPASFDETTGRLHMPVVAVQMVSGPDESRFYRRIWRRSVLLSRHARRSLCSKAWPCGFCPSCALACW